jgi:hypothetical protein
LTEGEEVVRSKYWPGGDECRRKERRGQVLVELVNGKEVELICIGGWFLLYSCSCSCLVSSPPPTTASVEESDAFDGEGGAEGGGC